MHVGLSPCVGVCRLDDETGYCLGCGRTGEEIAAWSTAGAGGRRAIWAALPARLKSLGVGVRRLPWTAADIRGFVLRTLRHGKGAWLLAAPGASASFPCPAPAGCEIRSCGEIVETIGTGAALRLRCDATARAFALDDATASSSAERVVLAVQASRPRPLHPHAGSKPQPDRSALRTDDRALPLHIATVEEQACAWWGVRQLLPPLAASAGAVALAKDLAGARGDVVISTALGRIEVGVALARFGAEVQAGPSLPEGFIPAAVFQPRL